MFKAKNFKLIATHLTTHLRQCGRGTNTSRSVAFGKLTEGKNHDADDTMGARSHTPLRRLQADAMDASHEQAGPSDVLERNAEVQLFLQP